MIEAKSLRDKRPAMGRDQETGGIARSASGRRRRPNHRLAKIHRNYTVEDVARLFGIHKNTVREWIKNGLATIDDKRPMVILGRVLKAFLQARRASNKQSCRPGEMYCVRCRTPKFPAADMAEYRPLTETIGNLTAICPDCNSMMNRRVSVAKIGAVRGKMDISFPQAQPHIGEIGQPTVNSDLR